MGLVLNFGGDPMNKVKEFFVNIWKNYKPELTKGAIGIGVSVCIAFVFPGIFAALFKFGKGATDMGDGYWFDTFQKLFLSLTIYIIWKVLNAYFRQLKDKWDKRFGLHFVGEDPVANGIFCGLTYGAGIISDALVFIGILVVVLM